MSQKISAPLDEIAEHLRLELLDLKNYSREVLEKIDNIEPGREEEILRSEGIHISNRAYRVAATAVALKLVDLAVFARDMHFRFREMRELPIIEYQDYCTELLESFDVIDKSVVQVEREFINAHLLN